MKLSLRNASHRGRADARIKFSTGELEDFVQKMVSESDNIIPRAREYIENIPEDSGRLREPKRTKSLDRSMVSYEEKPR